MQASKSQLNAILLPSLVASTAILVWVLLAHFHLFSNISFPYPGEVATGFKNRLLSKVMYTNVITSLFRVGFGFALSVGLAIPMGLWMGMRIKPRLAFLPIINFFRNLSPLAWMPFAVTWFGIGDVSPIFLIFLAAFFPLVLATLAAVANIPSVYFRVAKDVGMSVSAQIWRVTMPAILPQIITALRVTAGLSWVVLVAAEMVAGAGGLGFAIWDDHNGLRPDLILVDMTMIGFIGIAIDILIQRMTKMPSVRWGYER